MMQLLNMQSYAAKLNFEDVQDAINDKSVVLLSTMDESRQQFLIPGTIPAQREEEVINGLLERGGRNSQRVIIYGECSADDAPFKRYKQLLSLGFRKAYVYPGGLLEWALLQDVYGTELFPSLGSCTDILAYRGKSRWAG